MACNGNISECIDYSTEAGNEYIRSIEKTLKAAIIASGNEKKYYPSKNSSKKTIRSHSIRILHNTLKNSSIHLISDEQATTVDKIHGG